MSLQRDVQIASRGIRTSISEETYGHYRFSFGGGGGGSPDPLSPPGSANEDHVVHVSNSHNKSG